VKGVWYDKGGETLEHIALCDMMFGEALTHPVYVTTIDKTLDSMSRTVYELNTRVIKQNRVNK